MRGQRHAPAAYYPRERPGTHCTEGWVGPRAGLDGGKSRPTGIRSPDRPAHSQSLYRLSYPAYRNMKVLVWINCRLSPIQTSELITDRFSEVTREWHLPRQAIQCDVTVKFVAGETQLCILCVLLNHMSLSAMWIYWVLHKTALMANVLDLHVKCPIL